MPARRPRWRRGRCWAPVTIRPGSPSRFWGRLGGSGRAGECRLRRRTRRRSTRGGPRRRRGRHWAADRSSAPAPRRSCGRPRSRCPRRQGRRAEEFGVERSRSRRPGSGRRASPRRASRCVGARSIGRGTEPRVAGEQVEETPPDRHHPRRPRLRPRQQRRRPREPQAQSGASALRSPAAGHA